MFLTQVFGAGFRFEMPVMINRRRLPVAGMFREPVSARQAT
jgi:hypothetical protein